MKHNSQGSLIKIGKGTGIGLAGSITGLLAGFIARALMARYGGENNYGLFSLSVTILNIASVLALCGLSSGATRNIAYFRAKGDNKSIQEIISSSLQIVLVASILICIALFVGAHIIALNIFHEPGLYQPLQIIALGLPFFTLSQIIAYIFIGFDTVKVQVYFQQIFMGLLFLLFLFGIMTLHIYFNAVFYTYLACLIIVFVFLMFYAVKKLPSPYKLIPTFGISPMTKYLFFFSAPLLAASLTQSIMGWMDTLQLGYLKSIEVVGFYNVAFPLAAFIHVPITAMGAIYVPIASGLYGKGLMSELKRNYEVLTKWITSITMPFFLILFLFSPIIIEFVYGSDYRQATNVLRILSLGYIINNLMGFNQTTLVAIGKTKYLMWSIIATGFINLFLNSALIPIWGMEGAAIATIFSINLVNTINLKKIHSITGAFPLRANLLKPLITSTIVIMPIYLLFVNFMNITIWMIPIIIVIFYLIYGINVLLTKSLDQEDVSILLSIEKTLGVNLVPLKRQLRRFV